MTPVPELMSKKIIKNIETAGSADNIQQLMFWTPPQMTVLANHNIKKVLLVGGNGVGKTILSVQQVKNLSLHCIFLFSTLDRYHVIYHGVIRFKILPC